MSSGPSARRVAFDVLRQVSGEDAYANLALAKRLARAGLETRDAAFVTELVAGTCRLRGTYDAIIECASGRGLKTMQPAVVDLLRLLAHQALSMTVPARAAVATTVELARDTVGQRVTGLVNAVGRRIAAHDLQEWVELLSAGLDETGRLAVTTHHPRWIVEALERVLPENEVAQALEVDNLAPRPTLVVRPGLAEVEELTPAVPTVYSPFGAVLAGAPGDLAAVREGRAGVQDEGSQLVCLALTRVEAPNGGSTSSPTRWPRIARNSSNRPWRSTHLERRASSAPTGVIWNRSGSTAPSPGSWWTPPAAAWGRCVAAPRPGGAAHRPTWRNSSRCNALCWKPPPGCWSPGEWSPT